jgi:hypothetical protein
MSKEKNNELETLNMLTQLMETHSPMYSIFGSIFGGSHMEEKYPYERLGNGFELRPLDIEDNRSNYCHLYKDGKQVTSQIFRKGGLSHGFKDGYCSLILYNKVRKTKGNTSGFDFGNHVLINELGQVKMGSKGLDHPNHLGGNVASLNHTFYNLLTGEAIMPKSSTTINAKNFLIVEHRYDFDTYSKEVKMPLGVYKIDKVTCEITLIDEIK